MVMKYFIGKHGWPNKKYWRDYLAHTKSHFKTYLTLLAIKDSNPGIIITRDHKMVDGNKATFGRAFWAFSDLINGFQYYCPLISIDNTYTYLYGKYKAKL